MLSVDVEEKEDVVRDFLQDKDVSWKVLLDSDGKVAGKYGIQSHPMKFLIDPEGRVVGIAEGYRKWDSNAMKSLIRQLVEQKSEETVSKALR
jgi:peroxiredoxin